jgi:hypothetical protein
MKMPSFLNAKRVRDYPRLMLLTILAVLAINLLLSQGWIGGFGQVMGGDYVVFYATGWLYHTDPTRIYDFAEQYRLQGLLVQPSILPGLNPFINPPYVAMLCSLSILLPLPWSFAAWTCLSILFCVAAVYLLTLLLPQKLQAASQSKQQILILTLSFFPFMEGLLAGQNHGLTLLLVTGILVAAYHKRWLLSGALAGAMIYKPQLIIGLLVIWLVWKNFKALAGFSAVAIVWVGSFLLMHGISPFLDYLHASQLLLSLPYFEGFPGYIITTFYGLLTSIFPESTIDILQPISLFAFILAAGVVAWLAHRQRKLAAAQELPILALGLIFPLAFAPYVQLHDLILVVPVFMVWAMNDTKPQFFPAAVFTYAGAFFFTLLAAITGIAWIAIITLGLFVQMSRWNISLLRLQERLLVMRQNIGDRIQ